MKSAPTALIDFLRSAQEYIRADLYTFALTGGGVLRYASAGQPIAYGGQAFNLGPPIGDHGVQSQRGLGGSSVDIVVLGDERFLVNGQPFLDFVENLGLDGAGVRIDRVFAASWSDMAAAGPVGGYCRFSGRFSEAKELGQTQVVITAASYLDVLATSFPAEVYQSSCLNVFGDANCGVDVAALAASGTVSGAPVTPASFGSDLTRPDGYFALGVLTFTSGANAGLARSVKSYANAGGTVALSAPLPATPAPGDAFTVTPGCLLSMAACQGWQPATWAERFRGQPFIPPPSTGLAT